MPSNDKRRAAAASYTAGESISSLARYYDVDRKTIRRWIAAVMPVSAPSPTTVATSRGLGRRHMFVPDIQQTADRPTRHWDWLIMSAMDHHAEVVVFAGDIWDLPSLSTHSPPGSRSREGLRLREDLDSGVRQMHRLLNEWDKRGFAPEIHLTMGNHENRLARAIAAQPSILDGLLGDDPFELADTPIIVHEFLRPVEIDGVRYSHYFPHNAKGLITQSKNGAPSAEAQAKRQMQSATAGHQQGFDYKPLQTCRGQMHGLIAGSFYLHDESYMPENNYWRGLVIKRSVRDGDYALKREDMEILEWKYGGKSV